MKMFFSSPKKEVPISSVLKIKSPEYLRLYEQLKTATELQHDVPLNIVINYLGPDLGLIDRLQTAAENTLRLAESQMGNHQAYEHVLQTAFYYQAAWTLAKRYQLEYCYPIIIEQLKTIEREFPRLVFEAASLRDEKQIVVQDFQLYYQNNNPYKKELSVIREFAKKQLKTYQKQSVASDSKAMTIAAAQKPLTMQAIYRDISQRIRTLFIAIISEGIAQYQKLTGVYPPCAYSFIALGSLAREEITPYSDLEFGVLIEDKLDNSINNKNKVYFRNLCRLINFKLLALAETPANFISKEFGEKVGDLLGAEKYALIPKGFCFDAFVAGGYKNPLGKRDEQGELIFELIGTPSELADYQDEKHYAEKGKLVSEPLLPGSLTQARLIVSSQANEQLLKQYHQKVAAYLNQPAKQLWRKTLDSSLNLTLYQSRALELLVADIGRFRPKLGKQEEGGRSFAAKHDLYRLPNMMFDQLALYFNLTQTNLWEQLKTLAHSTTAAHPVLFNPAAAENLARAIDQATEYRLATYLALEEQAESVELTDDSEKAMTSKININTNNIIQKVFYLPKESVFDLYRTLIPFWHAMRGFSDSKGQNIHIFKDVLFNDFYSKALWVEANMQLLLQGHPQALSLLQPELKKILVSPSVTINGDEKNLVGTLRFAHPTNTMRDSEVEQALIFYTAGQAYLESNSALEEAKDCLTRALAIFQADNNKVCSAEIMNCYLGIAWINWLQQNLESAKSHHAKGLQLVQTQFGERHPYYAECKYLASYLQQKPGQISNLKLPERIGNWHIPPDNKHFIGRTETLKKLAAHFKPAQAGMKICFLSTISGLGGIGKTQIALKFLHHSGHDYALRLWFRAEQEHTLLQDYIELAERFRLMAMGERLSKEEVIERVKKYLENNPDWLAVYDNATNYASIKQFLPTRGGHVVITTRYSKETLNNELKNEKAIDTVTLEIDKFTPEEALQYLKEMIRRSGVEEEQAMHALAKELDYLPLALAQAAAYIKRRGITTKDYRERYKTSQQYLLKDKLLPKDSHSLPVATTWETTLRAIQEEEQNAGEPPLALAVLQAMSYLYADQIPKNILAQWLKVTRLVPKQEIENQLNKVLDRLAEYSMIHKDDSKNEIESTVSIHRLVQEVIRSKGLQQQVSKNLKLKSDEKTAETKINPDAKSAVMSEEEKKKNQEKEIALDQAFHLKQQSKRIYQQREQKIPSKPIDFKTAEDALRKSIAIYQPYKDSYAGELCDAFLDLALLLHAQGTNQSKQAAQKCLADAKQSLVKSYGKADAKQSRCKAVEWYLDAKRDNSIFAVKTYASFDTWQLPANNDEFFVGRESLIEKLNQHCKPDQAYQMLVLSAVSGLGGVGKTQLAIHYLYHTKHKYNLRAWFRAENASLLLSDYRSFAKEFDLIPVDEKTPREEIIGSVKRYLERHPDWLAVYDNAGSRDEIREFLPTKGGHLIVTTRRQEYDDVGIKVAVDVFTEQEAVVYLKKLTGITNQEKEMAELAKTLGCLPLAIGQAGVYIKKQNITIQQYLNDFKQNVVKLLEAQQLTLDDRSEAVATTWNISLKAIEQDEEENNKPHLSLPVLQAMAHLHAEDIPRNFLEKWLQEQKLVADPKLAKLALDQVIEYLSNYSLIHVDVERKTISVHRLLQEVIRQSKLLLIDRNNSFIEISQKSMLVRNMDQISGFLNSLVISTNLEFSQETNEVLQDEKHKHNLLIHMQALHEHIQQVEMNISPPQLNKSLGESSAELMLNIGCVLAEQKAMPSDAVKYFKECLKKQKIYYGKDHWQISKTLVNLANVYDDLGDSIKAKKLLDEALQNQNFYFEESSINLAPTLNNIGLFYLHNQGDIEEAKKYLERSLEIQDEYYKEKANDHHVVDTLVNLSELYWIIGDESKAKKFIDRAIMLEELHYGKDHWRVAITLINIGNLHFQSGNELKAKELFERALKIQKLHYGKDSWMLATALTNLAGVYIHFGETSKAKEMHEQALLVASKHYGTKSLALANVLSVTGASYVAINQMHKAEEILRSALDIEENNYGKDHWRSIETLNNLANACRNVGKLAEAKDLLQRAIKIEKGHHGETHRNMASLLGSFANACRALGDVENLIQAENAIEKALEIEINYYGKDHPKVATSLGIFSGISEALGDVNKTIELLEKASSIEEAYYGKGNPQTVKILVNLANAYYRSGDIQKQIEILEDVLKICKVDPEPNLLVVAISCYNLAVSYQKREKTLQAYTYAKRAHEIFSEDYSQDPRAESVRQWLMQLQIQMPPIFEVLDLICKKIAQDYKQANDIDNAVKYNNFSSFWSEQRRSVDLNAATVVDSNSVPVIGDDNKQAP